MLTWITLPLLVTYDLFLDNSHPRATAPFGRRILLQVATAGTLHDSPSSTPHPVTDGMSTMQHSSGGSSRIPKRTIFFSHLFVCPSVLLLLALPNLYRSPICHIRFFCLSIALSMYISLYIYSFTFHLFSWFFTSIQLSLSLHLPLPFLIFPLAFLFPSV